MARKPEATSIPPDTGDIDVDWNDTSSVVDSKDHTPDQPTAVPPGPYENYAQRVSSLDMSDEQARRALSAPNMPLIDPADADGLLDVGAHDSVEMEASAPMIGRQVSGPYAIPLELGDDGEEIHSTERPIATDEDSAPSFPTAPTPKIEAPDPGVWGDEAPTPTVTSPDALRALRKASSSGGPAIRVGQAADQDGPEISIDVGEAQFDLDEPGGIAMEDSLELSLDNIPPAPFELSPRPHEAQPASAPPEPANPMALSLDGGGDALDLVAARATTVPPDTEGPLVDLRDRYAVGDFTGAHELAELILAEDPNNEEALRFRESCRDVLSQMYTARLGSTARVPRLAIPTAELQWQSLDHRSGFLLSCIDGQSTIEEILDVSGMPPLDALRILYNLLQQQIIEVADG